MKQPLIYLDNAATSFPKPGEVIKEVEHTFKEVGGSPGRSGHRMAIAANRVIFETREKVAKLLGVKESSRIIFTSGATESLNLAIKGILKPGDHVITSNLEHNALSRPLASLVKGGVEVSKFRSSDEGFIDLSDVEKAIKGNTTLIVMTHASNVVGAIEPVKEIGAIAKERGIPFLVDACQTAGAIPIDIETLNADLIQQLRRRSDSPIQ